MFIYIGVLFLNNIHVIAPCPPSVSNVMYWINPENNRWTPYSISNFTTS
jgi:hypothetical protein